MHAGMLMHAKGVSSSFHLWRAGMKVSGVVWYDAGQELQVVMLIWTQLSVALGSVRRMLNQKRPNKNSGIYVEDVCVSCTAS